MHAVATSVAPIQKRSLSLHADLLLRALPKCPLGRESGPAVGSLRSYRMSANALSASCPAADRPFMSAPRVERMTLACSAAFQEISGLTNQCRWTWRECTITQAVRADGPPLRSGPWHQLLVDSSFKRLHDCDCRRFGWTSDVFCRNSRRLYGTYLALSGVSMSTSLTESIG